MIPKILQALIGCITLTLLAGCLAPPKPHPWDVTRADAPALQNAHNWPDLSTNLYQRVPDEQCSNAVVLLKNVPFVRIDGQKAQLFAPTLHVTSEELQPYLVRGVSYCSPPYFTELSFDESSSSLLVQQFTYNGETLMPVRRISEPNALVVFLPRAPSHVFVHAVLGGDGIFRGRKNVDVR